MLVLFELLAVSGGLSSWLPVICYIIGLVLLGIAAFYRPEPPPSWNRFVAGGLFFWLLGNLIVILGGV